MVCMCAKSIVFGHGLAMEKIENVKVEFNLYHYIIHNVHTFKWAPSLIYTYNGLRKTETEDRDKYMLDVITKIRSSAHMYCIHCDAILHQMHALFCLYCVILWTNYFIGLPYEITINNHINKKCIEKRKRLCK